MMKDGKMSKSKGNTIYPDTLAKEYGVDSVRYTILRSLPYGQDGEFTPSFFIEKYNTELCNDLGNLVNRSIAMINKYFNGFITKTNTKTDFDDKLDNYINDEINLYEKEIETINIQNAISHIMNIVSRTNKYIDETTPWVLAKEEKTDLLNQVMYNLFNTIRKIGILLYPFIPDTSNKILEQLNIHDENLTSYNSLKTTLDLTGNKVEEKVSPLFQRLDAKKEEEKLIELMKTDNEK